MINIPKNTVPSVGWIKGSHYMGYVARGQYSIYPILGNPNQIMLCPVGQEPHDYDGIQLFVEKTKAQRLSLFSDWFAEQARKVGK